jgi:hypothetical protein
MKNKYKPKPLTKEEWESLMYDWNLICSSEKRKKYNIEDAKLDFSWSHYVVGNLIESIKKGTKYEN